jgi:hypothetical protein
MHEVEWGGIGLFINDSKWVTQQRLARCRGTMQHAQCDYIFQAKSRNAALKTPWWGVWLVQCQNQGLLSRNPLVATRSDGICMHCASYEGHGGHSNELTYPNPWQHLHIYKLYAHKEEHLRNGYRDTFTERSTLFTFSLKKTTFRWLALYQHKSGTLSFYLKLETGVLVRQWTTSKENSSLKMLDHCNKIFESYCSLR